MFFNRFETASHQGFKSIGVQPIFRNCCLNINVVVSLMLINDLKKHYRGDGK